MRPVLVHDEEAAAPTSVAAPEAHDAEVVADLLYEVRDAAPTRGWALMPDGTVYWYSNCGSSTQPCFCRNETPFSSVSTVILPLYSCFRP